MKKNNPFDDINAIIDLYKDQGREIVKIHIPVGRFDAMLISSGCTTKDKFMAAFKKKYPAYANIEIILTT